MTWTSAAKLLPTLLLSACCCGIDWMIPDSVQDAVLREAFEQGLEAASGNEVELSDGRIEVRGANGEKMVLQESADGIASQLPIPLFPGCDDKLGMSNKKDGMSIHSVGQDCKATAQELEAHYTRELEAWGDKAGRMELGEAVIIRSERADGSMVQAMITQEPGLATAVVMAQLPLGG